MKKVVLLFVLGILLSACSVASPDPINWGGSVEAVESPTSNGGQGDTVEVPQGGNSAETGLFTVLYRDLVNVVDDEPYTQPRYMSGGNPQPGFTIKTTDGLATVEFEDGDTVKVYAMSDGGFKILGEGLESNITKAQFESFEYRGVEITTRIEPGTNAEIIVASW